MQAGRRCDPVSRGCSKDSERSRCNIRRIAPCLMSRWWTRVPWNWCAAWAWKLQARRIFFNISIRDGPRSSLMMHFEAGRQVSMPSRPRVSSTWAKRCKAGRSRHRMGDAAVHPATICRARTGDRSWAGCRGERERIESALRAEPRCMLGDPRGDLVLMDMWAKLDRPRRVYYDITWVGYCGSRAAICRWSAFSPWFAMPATVLSPREGGRSRRARDARV